MENSYISFLFFSFHFSSFVALLLFLFLETVLVPMSLSSSLFDIFWFPMGDWGYGMSKGGRRNFPSHFYPHFDFPFLDSLIYRFSCLFRAGFYFGQEDFISIVRSTSWYEELRSAFYFPSFSLFVHQFENNTLFLLHILLLIFILTFFSSKMKIMSKFRILTYYWMISKSERPSKSHRSTPCHSSFEKHFCNHISTWLFFI